MCGKGFLLHDRDPLFSEAFRETLAAAGVRTVRLPPRSPNLNAHAERFVRTIKEDCLHRLVLVGERSLRRAVNEFVRTTITSGITKDDTTRSSSPRPWSADATGRSPVGPGSAGS